MNDFLISKSTGYVYQITKLNDSHFEIIKLGNVLREKIQREEIRNYNLVSFLSNEGKDIVSLRKKVTSNFRDQFIVYDFNKNNFYIESSINIDNETYDFLKEKFTKGDFHNLNNDLKDEINSYRKEENHSKIKFSEMKKEIERFHNQEKEEVPQEGDLIFNVIKFNDKEKLSNVILHPLTKSKIDDAVIKYKYKNVINNYLSNESIKSNKEALVLNLYGVPGTGKTISAKAFANKVGKDVLVVDFAQLVSKMVGDTGKNIQKYFKEAKEKNYILLFDEADSLVQKRITGGDTHSYYVNQQQNIFMRELDNFDGIVILTTNLFSNYDEALIRRMTSIEYPLPNEEMRVQIINNHLSKNANYEEGCSSAHLSKLTEDFSGGDIKNLVEQVGIRHVSNTISNLSLNEDDVKEKLNNSVIKLDLFLNEIKSIKSNKNNYKNLKGNQSKIGL